MLTHYRELFKLVHKRPGMYGVKTYWETAAFVTGCDAATSWMLLEGFREWLQIRLGEPSSFVWPGIVLQLTTPTYERSPRELTPAVEAAAHDRMFELLDQFLAAREQRNGLSQIFGQYAEWHNGWEKELRQRLQTESDAAAAEPHS